MERASETLERLKVNPDTGLTQQQVQENRQQYGENQFTREKPDSFVKRLLESAKEPMTIMLIAAAIITLGVNIVRAATGGRGGFSGVSGHLHRHRPVRLHHGHHGGPQREGF